MNADPWSVLIITLYGGAPLEGCIRSIQSQTVSPNRIVVVVTAEHSLTIDGVEVICLQRNAHYAEGVNVGIDALANENILILNDDTVLAPDCIQEISMQGIDHIIQPQICLQANPDQLDNIGHKIWPDGMNFAYKRGQKQKNYPNEALLIFSGAAVALPSKIIARVGKFDVRLSPFGEDVDYALRASRRGVIIQSCPKAKVYHRLGGSYGRVSNQKIFWVERHRLLLMLKSAPPALIFSLPLSSVLRYLLQFYGTLNNQGTAPSPRFEHVLAIFKAYISASRSASSMIQSRKQEQIEWTLNNRTFLQQWFKQLPSLNEIWHPPLGSSSPHTEPNPH
ncbi:MAG: glycosyltransferase family 2 protein [Myxococcota bacterium]|nr:glycosyltransferase family 2 protein [Myxococcota bacterium]